MEKSTKKILSMTFVYKLQTNHVSNTMEYTGFTMTMQEMQDLQLDIQEIVTDTHAQIARKIGLYSNYGKRY